MNSSTQTVRKSRTGLILFLIGLTALLLLCGGPLTWWFGRQSVANRRLQTKKAELAARQLPVDDRSLATFREQQMSNEKSQQWVRILETFETDEFRLSTTGLPIVDAIDDEQPFVPGQPWPYAEDVSTFLENWSQLRQDMHEVTENTESIWTHIEFESFATLLPYVQSTRTAARLFTLEHIDAVRRDDREQAFHSLLGLIGVSRSLEKEPLLISQLVHIATLGVALRQIKMSLEVDLLNDEQLLAILDQLQQIPLMGDRYRIAIAGERAMALPAFENPSSLGSELPRMPLGSRSIDALAALEIYENMESIDTDSLDSFFAGVKQVDADFETTRENAGLLRRFDTILTDQTIPALEAFGTAFARSEMEVRLVKAAIGVRLYEHRFDRWPQSFDDLAKLDVDLGPLQPLGPKPFGLRVIDGDAVMWGFDLHQGGTQVPDEPIDLSALDESQRSGSEFWSWRLQK